MLPQRTGSLEAGPASGWSALGFSVLSPKGNCCSICWHHKKASIIHPAHSIFPHLPWKLPSPKTPHRDLTSLITIMTFFLILEWTISKIIGLLLQPMLREQCVQKWKLGCLWGKRKDYWICCQWSYQESFWRLGEAGTPPTQQTLWQFFKQHFVFK